MGWFRLLLYSSSRPCRHTVAPSLGRSTVDRPVVQYGKNTCCQRPQPWAAFVDRVAARAVAPWSQTSNRSNANRSFGRSTSSPRRPVNPPCELDKGVKLDCSDHRHRVIVAYHCCIVIQGTCVLHNENGTWPSIWPSGHALLELVIRAGPLCLDLMHHKTPLLVTYAHSSIKHCVARGVL